MSELRKAAHQALEALENDVTQRTYAGGVRICNAAIALRAALAQPEQEPLKYVQIDEIYRKVRGLPKECNEDGENISAFDIQFARAIEKAHGIGEDK